MTSTALLTDRYEFTMLDAALRSGAAHLPATFEVFTRSLPDGRTHGVLAGTARVLDAIENFTFDADTIDWLRANVPLSEDTYRYLADYRFGGRVSGYREGDTFYANSPVLTVRGTFGECVVLETVILSILNHDSAVASAAARMVAAANGADLIEMGGRRVDPDAAVAGARAAYIAGFTATSNLQAGRRYGIPTVGTSAHAFTLAHRHEPEAFHAQIAALGVDTTLLVDTYDICEGIQNACAAAQLFGRPGPGAIRIDSGDLLEETKFARFMLDALGATDTKIVVSGDLDEYEIARLVSGGAPIDSYGVGTKVATGSGHPTVGFVYKVVSIAADTDPTGPEHPVAKRSTGGKATVGGAKTAYLFDTPDGRVEIVATSPSLPDGAIPRQFPLTRTDPVTATRAARAIATGATPALA